eukprot:226467-Rhodomonas_salina.1
MPELLILNVTLSSSSCSSAVSTGSADKIPGISMSRLHRYDTAHGTSSAFFCTRKNSRKTLSLVVPYTSIARLDPGVSTEDTHVVSNATSRLGGNVSRRFCSSTGGAKQWRWRSSTGPSRQLVRQLVQQQVGFALRRTRH